MCLCDLKNIRIVKESLCPLRLKPRRLCGLSRFVNAYLLYFETNTEPIKTTSNKKKFPKTEKLSEPTMRFPAWRQTGNSQQYIFFLKIKKVTINIVTFRANDEI